MKMIIMTEPVNLLIYVVVSDTSCDLWGMLDLKAAGNRHLPSNVLDTQPIMISYHMGILLTQV